MNWVFFEAWKIWDGMASHCVAHPLFLWESDNSVQPCMTFLGRSVVTSGDRLHLSMLCLYAVWVCSHMIDA